MVIEVMTSECDVPIKRANSFKVVDGRLHLYDEDEKVVAIFAEGMWAGVIEKDDEDED